MDSTENEIWRMVPPEEKFELMAKAQSKGVGSAAIYIIVLCTMSVALKMGWLMWFGILTSPFVFQFSAGKEWRNIRPRVLLEYLAVRSASRRFAFNVRSKELSPKMILKGTLEKVYDNEHVQEAMEAIIASNKSTEVWITLFGDAFTMICEAPGGAEVRLAALIDQRLKISSNSTNDYVSNKELFITVKNRLGESEQFKLTSRYPAALVVFEKKVKQVLSKTPSTEGFEEIIPDISNIEQTQSTVSDDKFDSLFSF
jgi:hypothetical protein